MASTHQEGSRLLAAALAALVSATSTGCTFIGWGIGAATPRPYEVTLEELDKSRTERKVVIELVREPLQEGEKPRQPDSVIEGVYLGRADSGEVLVWNKQGTWKMSAPTVQRVRTYGDYAAAGIVTGALIDIVIGVVIVSQVNSAKTTGSGGGYGLGSP